MALSVQTAVGFLFLTLSAAALTRLIVPPLPAIIPLAAHRME